MVIELSETDFDARDFLYRRFGNFEHEVNNPRAKVHDGADDHLEHE